MNKPRQKGQPRPKNESTQKAAENKSNYNKTTPQEKTLETTSANHPILSPGGKRHKKDKPKQQQTQHQRHPESDERPRKTTTKKNRHPQHTSQRNTNAPAPCLIKTATRNRQNDKHRQQTTLAQRPKDKQIAPKSHRRRATKKNAHGDGKSTRDKKRTERKTTTRTEDPTDRGTV